MNLTVVSSGANRTAFAITTTASATAETPNFSKNGTASKLSWQVPPEGSPGNHAGSQPAASQPAAGDSQSARQEKAAGDRRQAARQSVKQTSGRAGGNPDSKLEAPKQTASKQATRKRQSCL